MADDDGKNSPFTAVNNDDGDQFTADDDNNSLLTLTMFTIFRYVPAVFRIHLFVLLKAAG